MAEKKKKKAPPKAPPSSKKKSDKGKPLGVPEGHTTKKPGVKSRGDTNARGELTGKQYGYSTLTPTTYEVAPRFYESDIDRLASQSPERIAGLQASLVQAGLLSQKGFSLGVWDNPTRSAYRQVLEYANRAGLGSAEEALGVFLASTRPRGGGGGGGGTRAPFVAQLPNPDDVRKAINTMTPDILGRTLSRAEEDALVATYNDLLMNQQRAEYGAAESGGTITEAPDLKTLTEQRVKETHGAEADTFEKFSRVNDVMGLLFGGSRG